MVNNVTIYKVDILPKEIPDVFRSGMSANVDVIVRRAEGVLLIPSDALIQEGGKAYVLVKDPSAGALAKREVVTGLENDGFVEIRSGISKGDVVHAPKQSYVVPTNKNGGSPFFPQFRKKGDKPEK